MDNPGGAAAGPSPVMKVPYGGWQTCWRLANETVELIVTGEVGPRIIRFGYVGGVNEFAEYRDQLGKTGGEAWRIYGGHRLWHAPEVDPRTYAPDNAPVRVEQRGCWTCFVPPVEQRTGIAKELWVRLLPGAGGEGRALVRHVLRNEGPWEVELAPWAISVMAPGGTAVVPLPPRGSHDANLLPASSIALWAYSDLSDSRWSWLRTCVLLRQDPDASSWQKAGMLVTDGWAAYARSGHLFVKSFPYRAEAKYPDFGCSVECFTCAEMLELESLGPLARLEHGRAVEHLEAWTLWKGVPVPTSAADVEADVAPRARESLLPPDMLSQGGAP
jgi:hypothetical protein